MPVLGELFEQNLTRRESRDVTLEEAVQYMGDEPEVQAQEAAGVPIRDLMAGRKWVMRYGMSSHLESLIHQMFFFTEERENWSRTKRKYLRCERRFSKSLLAAIRDIHRNIFWTLAIKPPIDRDTFNRLMIVGYEESMQKHWTAEQRRNAMGRLNAIRYYYECFNRSSQEIMRENIDSVADDLLVI